MIRDCFKESSYFDVAINNLNNRIGLYKEKLNSGSVVAQNVELAKNMVVNMEYQLILLQYSRGDDLIKIKNKFILLMNEFVKNIGKSDYFSVTKFLSLAILLNVEKSCIFEIYDSLNSDFRSDWFISFIVSDYCNRNLNLNLNLLDCRFGFFKEFILGDDRNLDEFASFLSNTWYDSNKDQPWYDSHKAKGEAYKRYFCFEAGAVSKLLKLDDNSLMNCKFYPYDLVHFDS